MSRALIGRIAGTLVVVLMLVAVDTRPLAAAARVEITPTGTPAEYRVEARGFEDWEEISTWLTGPNQQVMAAGVRDTDERGRANFRLRLPRHVQPGRWAITVHGNDSDREAIALFDVPLRGPDISLTVSPEHGPAGTTFRFTSGDFDAWEYVSTWLTAPDGVVYPGSQLEASGVGSIDFAYTMGSTAQPGRWFMSAAGWQSDHYGVATFVVD